MLMAIWSSQIFGRSLFMEKLFINIFNMSISASYLVFAVLIVRFFLRKAPKTMRCFLWFLVGIRLLFPFSIESVFSLIPDTKTVEASLYEMQQEPDLKTETVYSPATSSIQKTEISFADDISVNRPKSWISVCARLWIVGIGLMMGYMAISWLRLASRVKTAIPNDVALDEACFIRIYQSDRIEMPFLFGIVKPRIYIPYSISDKDLPYVILHEKTHRRSGDYLIKPIGFILLSVYWFNPCMWIAYILLCRDIELVCDERVVQQIGIQCKKEYSQALLSCAVNRRMIAACPVAFGEVGVKERVKNILDYKKPAFWILAAAILACIIVPVCFMTQKKEKDFDLVEDKSTQNSGTTFAEMDVYKLTAQQEQLLKNADELSQKTSQNSVLTDDELKEALAQIEELEKDLQIQTADLQKELEVLKELEAKQGKNTAKEESLLQVSEQFETAVVQLKQQKKQLNELLNHVNTDLMVRELIEQWAQAFCSRDGGTIIRLANDKTEQKFVNEDMLVCGFEDGKDYAAFGWSSPWPWDLSGGEDASKLNYRIVDIKDRSAEILYYAWVSDPHVTVWRELLTYEIKDDKFAITSEILEYRDNICTLEEFYQAYPHGVIKGTMMDYYSYNEAGEALNEHAKERYTELFQPDTAAIALLNLLQNPNKVGTVVKPSKDENTCTVTLEFYEHGDSVDVTMIRPYGKDGIWLPWSEGETKTGSSQSGGSYIISNMIVDEMMKKDAQTLDALFPNHHEFMSEIRFPKSVDLNGDGIEEKIEMVNLGYNGGDGGYALRITDTKTGRQIPLPDGYTEDTGFPIMTKYREHIRGEEASIQIQLGKENQYTTIAELQIDAVIRIYERKHMDSEIKTYLQEEAFGEIRADAVSGCNIITFNNEETPTIVLKTYISGLLGHVDTLGYVITELRLQKDNTWKSNSYFLLDGCNDIMIQQSKEQPVEQDLGDSNLLFDNDTHVNFIPLQPEA